MEIIPAIDLKDGKCVRLYQGDFSQSTVYDDDPVAVARRWVEQGAGRLHVVDLDGARVGRPVNTDTVLAIVRAVAVPVQLGGGLRNEEGVTAALSLGVERVILGTSAVRDPVMVERMVNRFQERVIVGIDTRNGLVAVEGWTETAEINLVELIERMHARGVRRIIYTDISRDGTLTEPNFAALQRLIDLGGPAIIASGGIADIDHLRHLAQLGVEGAIVGKALYTGSISLPAAIAGIG
jgi:phosphoribosylformimino-5-aminoimidazole carboxamide ribotide isomerase